MSSPASVWFATLSPTERRELNGGSDQAILTIPDVLVVGGGIIGLATAYFLADRGASVQVIEAGTIASGSSGANAGGIWPNDQGPSHTAGFQQLAFLSRDLWGRLSLRPDFDFEWRVNGVLNVNPEKFPPSASECAAHFQEQGYTVHAVDAGQIALLEPGLKPGLTSGLHFPSEAHLHPVKAALSFARAALRKGAGIATGVAARSLDHRNGRVITVETTAGPIAPRFVVSATGWTAEWLQGAISELPPLRSVSGQLIGTDPLPPLLKGAVVGKFLILQLRTGEVVTGGNLLESESLIPDPALSAQFADAARELVPQLRDVSFPLAWCGRRPTTPDGLPIIDRAPGLDNLFLAGGHYRNGVLLAPATGKLLSEWILCDAPAAELAAFQARRFAR
ncbi:MAG: NAD(P)/FAD-dependent oxidoreductase [Deltaproteobacteria bacterium]